MFKPWLLSTLVLGAVLSLAGCDRNTAATDANTGAASNPTATMPSAGEAAKRQHQGTGTVTAVDVDARRVTIAHDPMPTLEWPAMTMAFAVTQPDALRALKPGQKVVFSVVEGPSDGYQIVEIRPE